MATSKTASTESNIKIKKVAIIVYDGVEILDVTGPYSVFSKANTFKPDSYELCILADREGDIKTNTGLRIGTHGTWKTISPDSIDTLIIAGGDVQGFIEHVKNSELISWLSSINKRIRRVVSICTGVFALGYAGLLQGRQVTTHWSACELLQTEFPEALVLSDKVFVRDGNLWSSAGILTGIDLALSLVEEDTGRENAINIGNLLVIAGVRGGGSPQKSTLLSSQSVASHPLRELISWLQFNFNANCSVEALASRAGLSPRHFSRLFISETGISPSRYVMTIRLDHAASLLKTTNWSLSLIAQRSGFLSTDSLRRGFIHRWGVTPAKYRETSKYSHNK